MPTVTHDTERQPRLAGLRPVIRRDLLQRRGVWVVYAAVFVVTRAGDIYIYRPSFAEWLAAGDLILADLCRELDEIDPPVRLVPQTRAARGHRTRAARQYT